jgi:hypothetical protein
MDYNWLNLLQNTVIQNLETTCRVLPVLGGSGWARAPIGKKATTRPKKLKF